MYSPKGTHIFHLIDWNSVPRFWDERSENLEPTRWAVYHSSPTQLHTSLLHSQRQLVTHNIGVPMKQATWGHQGSTHHTLFQGGRAGQNDQPAAAGQCASCKLQTTKPKACSNQLRQQQISTMHTLNIHTQHK